MRYKNRACIVIDNGLFVELAVTLSKDFGRVFYYSPWVSAFPKSNSILVGKDVPGITRVDDFWGLLDEIDLFVFPDVYFGGLQEHLVKLGKRVWGGRMGEDIELYRQAQKNYLKSVGIDVGPYKVLHGLDKLRAHLQAHDHQYVKVSRTRGDMETFYSKNYKLIEPKLDELEATLGAKKRVMDFIVEARIDDAVEVGYDGYSIDGEFPKQAMWGVEVKDKGFVMATQAYDDLPQAVRDVNAKMSSALRGYGYRGFFSTEIRVVGDKAYVIDPCMRAGSPPSELYQVMVENWADVIWEGADGVLVEPKFRAKFGAELLLLSSWADQNWQAVEFPKAIRENVKLRNLTVIGGRYYVVPQAVGLPEIGAVVAYGDTVDEAIKRCKDLAGKVEGHYIETVPDSLEEAKSEMAKMEELA